MSPPRSRDDLLWWAIAGLASFVAILTPLLAHQALRTAAVLVFLLWASGATVVGLVPGLSTTARAALAPGTSVALVLLGASLLLLTDAWHPRVALLVAAVVCCLLSIAAFASHFTYGKLMVRRRSC